MKNGGIFDKHGHHIGWYEDGVLYDRHNRALGFTGSHTGYLPSTPGMCGEPGMPGLAGRPGMPGLAGMYGRPGYGGWSQTTLEDFVEQKV